MISLKNISYYSDSDGQMNTSERQTMDLYIPDQAGFKSLIFFHGGGLESGDKSDCLPFLLPLLGQNYAIATANYRLYPDAAYPDFIQDAAAAVARAVELIHSHDAASEIYIGGSSAGAYLAMMLCFDEQYLQAYGLDPDDFSGFIFDSPQPTVHFNVLRERGMPGEQIVVDHASSLYHIKRDRDYPSILFIAAEHDIPNRLEQIEFCCSVLSHFNFAERVRLIRMDGYTHCAYCEATDEHGEMVFAKIMHAFMSKEQRWIS